MAKKMGIPLAEFDEFAQRGQRVVAHRSVEGSPYPKERKQALKIVKLGEKIAKLVVLEARAGLPGREDSPVKQLQREYASILHEIGGRARASKTGFRLVVPAGLRLRIARTSLKASYHLRKYKRLNPVPAFKKKTKRRKK